MLAVQLYEKTYQKVVAERQSIPNLKTSPREMRY